MFQGADFGFVGPSYEAPDILQDAQRSINYYCEVDNTKGAKEPIALLGCPGMNALFPTGSGPVRGSWMLPGGDSALIVTGNTVYLATIVVRATPVSLPVFQATAVGTLLTNSGPVTIRDNGVYQNPPGLGGYAVIVDGFSCFYYLLSGVPQVVTFTGAVANTSPTITLPGSLPNGLVIASGGVLTDSSGYIPAATNISSVSTSLLTITMTHNATNTNATDTITLTIPAFGQITDSGFLGATHIAFIEGWLIFNLPDSRTFYTTGPTPYQMLFPGSFYALKDSSTDNLICLYENNRELWLIGSRTSEVWYNAGAQNFAFQRLPGVGPQIGCESPFSLTRVGQVLVWQGANEQGQDIIVCQNGYSWERISTHAVEYAISTYTSDEDGIAYGYEDQGHLFYVLTFPLADVTWVYDFTSKLWHQRASYDPVAGVFHRHRGNCFLNFADVRMVGDYETGWMCQLSHTTYADNYGTGTSPLVAVRRSPHVWSKENRERVFCSQLQIEFTPGVGLQTGQGQNPQVMLRWSDDGGFTWSNEHYASIGAAGKTRNRAVWRALGHARDRVWEASISDPVPRNIIGATLYAEVA